MNLRLCYVGPKGVASSTHQSHPEEEWDRGALAAWLEHVLIASPTVNFFFVTETTDVWPDSWPRLENSIGKMINLDNVEAYLWTNKEGTQHIHPKEVAIVLHDDAPGKLEPEEGDDYLDSLTHADIAERALSDADFAEGLRVASRVCRARGRLSGRSMVSFDMMAVYLDRLAAGKQP